jgi:hypothetical protein
MSFNENKRKGCEYCRDAVFLKPKTPSCPHDECPYQELKGHSSYIGYLKANNMNFYNIKNRRGKQSESN